MRLDVGLTKPGILFWLIFPSAVISVSLLVALVAYQQWFFAAWASGSVAMSVAALRWAWPAEPGE